MRYQQNLAVQLIHIFGPKKGQIDEFKDMPITIGRHPSCSLAFSGNQGGISRQHAEIVREGNLFKLIDHSTNGTFINGKGVKEAILKDGDILEFAEGGPKVSFITVTVELAKDVSTVPTAPTPHVGERVEKQSVASPEYLTTPHNDNVIKSGAIVATPIERTEGSTSKRVKAPLTILFGPQIRSFKEVPVVIGRGTDCDFSIDQPQILEKHLQIIFYDNRYWVEDLTGLHQVHVNSNPIEFKMDLHLNDEVRLSNQGPVFRFLGEGRLAEVADEVSSLSSNSGSNESDVNRDSKQNSSTESIWEKIKKKF